MTAYSIWVMEYAHVMQPTSLFIYGAHNQGHRKMPYGYIVIKGQGRTLMVDVGYNHEAYGKVLAESYGVEHWQPPRMVLAECGVTPDEVSTVFITHAQSACSAYSAVVVVFLIGPYGPQPCSRVKRR
jgi:N-acyl homoserine lactone hydrolase